jgi:hypothetical protein
MQIGVGRSTKVLTYCVRNSLIFVFQKHNKNTSALATRIREGEERGRKAWRRSSSPKRKITKMPTAVLDAPALQDDGAFIEGTGGDPSKETGDVSPDNHDSSGYSLGFTIHKTKATRFSNPSSQVLYLISTFSSTPRRMIGSKVWYQLRILLFLLISCCGLCQSAGSDIEYVIVGVSGGLQAGFPDHNKIDYHPGEVDEVQGVFLGRALVRGYKSYLDVMETDWRQYTPEPGQPLINSNVYPSGCHEHANQYWMYLVDKRQFFTILMMEPRFLSIAPDLGLVDLTVRETSPVVKHIALHEISKQGKQNSSYVAFPIVTAAWFNPSSHVESPVLYTLADGTEITNFAQSLAMWAGVIAEDSCTAAVVGGDDNFDSESFAFLAPKAQEDFWQAIRKSVRLAENNSSTSLSKSAGPPYECSQHARFGVSNDMARINYSFSSSDFATVLASGGFSIDFKAAVVKSVE